MDLNSVCMAVCIFPDIVFGFIQAVKETETPADSHRRRTGFIISSGGNLAQSCQT